MVYGLGFRVQGQSLGLRETLACGKRARRGSGVGSRVEGLGLEVRARIRGLGVASRG